MIETHTGPLALDGMLVIKFYSDNCAPCKKMDPIIKKMEEEFPLVKIYMINIDNDYELAKKYNIMSVPTLLFLNGSKEAHRIVGLEKTDAVRKTFKSFSAGK